MNLHDDHVNYYTAVDGSIRRKIPKVRMSKKERLRKRREDREYENSPLEKRQDAPHGVL